MTEMFMCTAEHPRQLHSGWRLLLLMLLAKGQEGKFDSCGSTAVVACEMCVIEPCEPCVCVQSTTITDSWTMRRSSCCTCCSPKGKKVSFGSRAFFPLLPVSVRRTDVSRMRVMIQDFFTLVSCCTSLGS